MLRAREFQHVGADHWMLSTWWKEHGWPVIPLDHLPKTGFIIFDNIGYESYCAGFLYMTDSKFGWLEFVIANPKTDHEKRSLAIDLLIETLLKAAQEKDMVSVFSSTIHHRLLMKYKKAGFKVGDIGVTQVIWRNPCHLPHLPSSEPDSEPPPAA